MKPAVQKLLASVAKINPEILANDLVILQDWPLNIRPDLGEANTIQKVEYIYVNLSDHLRSETDRSQELLEKVFDLFEETMIHLVLHETLNSMN